MGNTCTWYLLSVASRPARLTVTVVLAVAEAWNSSTVPDGYPALVGNCALYAAPEHDRAQPPQSAWQGRTHTFDFPSTLVGLEPNPSLQIVRVRAATEQGVADPDPPAVAGKTDEL